MPTANELRAKAEQCMRLARATSDKKVVDALMGLAAEYLERAAAAESVASQPPSEQPVAQQQQQIQPNKDDP